MKKTIVIGLIIVTSCIIYLTHLAGDALKSSINSQNVSNELLINSINVDTINSTCNKDSLQKDSTLSNIHSTVTDNDSTSTGKHPAKPTDSSELLDSIVYNLTLAVNSVNNVLTSGSIFIAILTLFIGIVGLFGFYSLKSDLKEKIGEFDGKLTQNSTRIDRIQKLINDCCEETKSKIKEVDNKFVDYEQRIDKKNEKTIEEIEERNRNLNEQITAFRVFLTQQEEYINRTINYLFQATYANINQMSDKKQAREILSRIHHDMQIARLYRTSLNTENNDIYDREKFAVFAYLEMNGTLDDIPHLDYVVDHDPNEQTRMRATEVRAIIRNRNNN